MCECVLTISPAVWQMPQTQQECQPLHERNASCARTDVARVGHCENAYAHPPVLNLRLRLPMLGRPINALRWQVPTCVCKTP